MHSPALTNKAAILRSGEQFAYSVRRVGDFGNGVGEAHLRIEVEVVENGATASTTRVARVLAEVLPGRRERRRVEYYKYAADVLFIIDTSPRMSALAQPIRAELETLMRSLYSYWRPTRVALTTANLDGGAFIIDDGTAAIVDVWEPDAVDRVLNKFDTLQWSATAEPRPLEAMVRAVTPPLSETKNAGFGSPERASLVYIITNGDDHSPGPVGDYLQDYFNAMSPWTIEEAQLSSKVVAIYPMSGLPTCSGAPMTGRLDELTTSFSSFTGWHPICLPQEEWKWFQHKFIVWDAEVPRRYCLPPIDTRHQLRVWLDGTELPQIDAHGLEQWRYDNANNCIVLTDPDDRTTVVEYEFWLAPICS